MIKKLILSLAVVMSSFMISFGSPVFAADCSGNSGDLTTQQALQCGANGGAGKNAPTPEQATNSFNNLMSTVLNLISVVVGILAVIMIVLSGARFITSSGNQEKVKSARSSLMYAVAGLVVVALAQVIVKLVLDKAISTQSTTTSTPSNLVNQTASGQ